MIPLVFLMLSLGWVDLPPRPVTAPRCPVRSISNRERRRILNCWTNPPF